MQENAVYQRASIFLSLITLFGYYQLRSQTENIASDTLFGKVIYDPYRWLEDHTSTKTTEWLSQEQSRKNNFFKQIGDWNKVHDRLEEISEVSHDRPNKNGPYFFTKMYMEENETARLYMKFSPEGEYKEIINPNKLYSQNKFSIMDYQLSGDAKYLAYEYAANGSDWMSMDILNVSNLTTLGDHLTNVRYSDIAWKGNGFFYEKYNDGERVNELTRQVLSPKIYYHKLRTPQEQDSLVFKRDGSPKNFFDIMTTSDERFFILKEIQYEKKTTSFFYVDYQSSSPRVLLPFIKNQSSVFNIVDNIDNRLIAVTHKNSEYGMVVSVDPSQPGKWDVVIPELPEYKIKQALVFKDNISVLYFHDHIETLIIYSLSGKPLHKMVFPFGRSCNIAGQKNDPEILLTVESYFNPTSLFYLNHSTYELRQVNKTRVNFDNGNYNTEVTSYKSFDGTEVPIYLVYDKKIRLDGNNPLLLTAYGGYGTTEEPSFDPGIVYFIERGGIFAYAAVRGGGEKGPAWHKAGAHLNKQNCFSDFIKAAEFVISKKYTNPQKLAITGGSHGGLVVGVAMTQRPDLFKVAIPKVGVFDMLRLQHATIGEVNTNEFGNIHDSVDVANMLSYSPYQHVNKNVAYPNTLVVTSDNDTRVPPFQSYKFCAALQDSGNPNVILDVEKKSGHNGSADYENWIRHTTDFYSFILFSFGMIK